MKSKWWNWGKVFMGVSLAGLLVLENAGSGQLLAADQTESKIVVIKNDGLYLVRIGEKEKCLKKGDMLSEPKISAGGSYAVYLSDRNVKNNVVQDLYVSSLGEGDKTSKVAADVYGFTWKDDHEILFSTGKGGLYGCEITSGKLNTYIQPVNGDKNKVENIYQEIVWDAKGQNIYAEKISRWMEKSGIYSGEQGLIQYNLKTQKEKMIEEGKPFDDETYGLRPRPVALSGDGNYLYIFQSYNSGSMTADGTPFAVYDVAADKVNVFSKEIFLVNDKAGVAINPVKGNEVVINNGGNREYYWNKGLVLLDSSKNSSQVLLPEKENAMGSPLGMDEKNGLVTMTPVYSPDGTELVFGGSNTAKDYESFYNEAHALYSLDLATGEKTILAKSSKGSIFGPRFIEDGKSIIYIKKTGSFDQSEEQLVLLRGGKETVLSSGLAVEYDTSMGMAVYDGTNLEAGALK